MRKFHKLEGRVSLYAVLGLLAGLFVLQCIAPEQSFAFDSAKKAIKEICGHMEGNLGGLLMTTAGVGALVAAAFGNFRASHSMIVTAIGAATVSTMLSLYFADAAKECTGGHRINTEAGTTTRTLDDRFALPGVLRHEPGALGEANIEIAAGRQADFTQAAEFNHGGEEFELAPAEDDGGLNDLADTF